MKHHNKKTHRVNSSLLLEKLEYSGVYSVDTVIEQTVFDCDTLTRKTIDATGNFALLAEPGKVNWLHVRGLKNTALIDNLCEAFGLRRLLVQDILNAGHIAKIEENDGCLLAVIDVFDYDRNDVLVREHLSFVLGKNFVLSFQESAENRFEMIDRALDGKLGKLRAKQADYLFNLLLGSVIDHYLEVLEIQQNMMLDLEDLLMEFRADTQGAGRKIQDCRKDYLALKKSIFPIREQFARLLVLDSTLIADSTSIYFKDTYDHLQQAYMMVESSRETIASLLDLYLANNDLRMNHIMKQLTVVSTVFIPLTFLVGVWGMNFRVMPEIDWAYGYLAAWLIMIAIAGGVYYYFKRKKWY